MIEARLGACSLEMHGHAGFAPKGSDPVCAAASGLAYALAYNLALSEGQKVRDVEVLLDEGEARIRAANTPEARQMFCFAGNGLALLAQNFPENISVERA